MLVASSSASESLFVVKSVANDWKGSTLNVPSGAIESTCMRYHELALQRWLNQVFLLRWGAPVPVVFTSPMDAYSLFSKLWGDGANNPFKYLLDVKDENGNPVYQPYPQPVRYPVISVYRKGWKLRPTQNFSIHRMRWINWPTVSSTGTAYYGPHQQGTDLKVCDLGEVTTSRFPMAFDFRFQIDHFCNRPDTQAYFLSQFFRAFWRTGGPQMQTWIKVTYPGFGDKLVRLYVDGDPQNMTPEEPEEGKNVEYRTSFTIVVEGYDIDLDYKIYPALWKLMLRYGSAPPEALNAAFDFTGTVDLREQSESSIVTYREEVAVMPDTGTCATALRDTRLQNEQVDRIYFNSLVITFPGPVTPPGYPPPSGVQVFGGGTLVPGIPTVIDGGTFSDGGTQSATFHVGSMDLYIHTEALTVPITFQSGAHLATIVSAGTLVDSGNFVLSFSAGSHTNAIVDLDAGSNVGTISESFYEGTHFAAVIDAGSYYENGSVSSIFTIGTHAIMILDAGTHFEAGTLSIGFYSGTHA